MRAPTRPQGAADPAGRGMAIRPQSHRTWLPAEISAGRRLITRFAAPLATRISTFLVDTFCRSGGTVLPLRPGPRCPIPSSSSPPAWPRPGCRASRSPTSCGEPMIVHVWRRAVEAGLGPVVVATDERAIVDAIESGGRHRGADARRPPVWLRPHLRGGRGLRPRGPPRRRRQRAGRPADHRSSRRAGLDPARSSDPDVDIATLAVEITLRGGAHRPQRGQGRRQPDRARPDAGALLHPRHRPLRRGAALPPYRALRLSPARRSPASSRCRPRRSRSASGWSSCARIEDGMRIDIVARRRRAARRRHAARSRARPRRSSASRPKATLKCQRHHAYTSKLIAYQGEPGANSHIACRDVYPGLRAAALRHVRGRLRRHQGRRRPRSA